MKKLFALLILLLFTQVSFAQEIPVQITPVKEYKTTNNISSTPNKKLPVPNI